MQKGFHYVCGIFVAQRLFGQILFIFALLAVSTTRYAYVCVYLSQAHVFVFVTLWHLVITHTYIHTNFL